MKGHKDILRNLAEYYRDWILDFEPEFQMLFVRWALVLWILLILGSVVRFRLAQRMKNTLPVQVVVLLLAVFIGFAIPLDWLDYVSLRGVTWAVSAGLISCLAVPYFLPMVLIRTRGLQYLARIGLYFFEILLLLAQYLVL